MSGKPNDIPQDIWDAADRAWSGVEWFHLSEIEVCARAILAERARWQPAATYFQRYCQDEAEDVENCVCGQQQHDDAKAFAAAIRGGADQENMIVA